MSGSEKLSLTITGDTSGDLTVDCSNGDPLPLSGLSADSQEIDVIGTAAAGREKTQGTRMFDGDCLLSTVLHEFCQARRFRGSDSLLWSWMAASSRRRSDR
jgi:hypothetical protein